MRGGGGRREEEEEEEEERSMSLSPVPATCRYLWHRW
jgi:hypothetical protein